MTETEPESWIRPDIAWSVAEASFVCVAAANDSVLQLIENDGVTVPILPKVAAEATSRLQGGLYGACCRHAALQTLTDQGVSPLPESRAQDVTFVLIELLRLREDRVLVLLGTVGTPSYGRKHPEHRELAKQRMQRYRNDVAEHERESIEADKTFRAQSAEFGLGEFDKMLDILPNPYLTRQPPAHPRLADIDLQLEEAAFVPVLPKNDGALRRAVADAVRGSKRGPSRNGRYDCTRIQSAGGGEAAIVRWTSRTSVAPALELKAALQQIFPSALLRPRLFDQHPPEPVAVGTVTEPRAGAFGGVDSLRDIDDLPTQLEESIGGLANSLQAVQDFRRSFRTNGFEALAWYQAFHRFAEPVWGIHFDAPKLDLLAWSLALDLQSSERQAHRLAPVLAVGLTGAHEMFHAKVEFAATWLEISSHRKRYLPYFDQIYVTKRNTADQLEEALANWAAHAWLLANLEALQEAKLAQDPSVVLRVVEDWLDFSPAGYREWRIGDRNVSWQRLSTELASVSQRPTYAQKVALPLEGLLRTETLIDLRREDVPLFLHGRGAVADALFSAPSRREVVRVLCHFGYQPLPGRGKGSHEVWRGPDNRNFTVPARDPLSVGVFHNLLAHFGWSKQQYLREIRS